MKTGLLGLWGVFVLFFVPFAGLPADVVPPTQVYALGLGVVCVLGLVVGAILLVCFWVIRAIKRDHTANNGQ